MSLRQIEQIIPAQPTHDGAGVRLLRSLGQTQQLRLDPFLMLDEFSSNDAQDYIAGFPDHPHRGFETVTYMLEGQMLHRDHMGSQGVLRSGGAQWMTAGRGIIHSEMPQQQSGRLHGFQLWINLPAKEKMKAPAYQDIQAEQIPLRTLANGGSIKLLAGSMVVEGESLIGPIQGLSTEPVFMDVVLPAHGFFSQSLDAHHHALLYVYDGGLMLGGCELSAHSAGILTPGEVVELAAGADGAAFLLLAGKPLAEPIVQYGPFVMNTREEIEQALADYRSGRLVEVD